MIVLLAGGATCAMARAQSLIHSPVNPSDRVTFTHTVPRRLKSGRDVGPVDPNLAMKRILLVLEPGPAVRSKLQAFLQSLQNRNSPNYHRWLTPGEFGSQFGPSAADVKQVTAWLKGQGFHIGGVAQGRRWIEFSGTARQVEAAFQTQIHKFEVHGKERISNATNISIPAALAPVVRGVVSLNDFFTRPMLVPHFNVRRDSSGNLVPVNPQFTTYSTNPAHYIAPGDFATLYDLAPLYQSGFNGVGETIAIVARAKLELSDVEYFRQVFGLPPNDPNIILNGSYTGSGGPNDNVETTLDAEWAGAVAPEATVNVVISSSTVTTDGVDLSASYIVDNDVADVMDVSYGACEQDMGPGENAFYDTLWQQAAAEGISVFVAAGDNGAAGCDDPSDPTDQPAQGGLAVNGLASTPYDTAVGGTQFNENGNDSYYWSAKNGPTLTSVNGYIPEDVWNQSCDPTVANSPCAGGNYNLYAGSGGVSTLYAKPSWQTALNVPKDGQRDLPDVSLAASAAHDGYLMCLNGSCQFDSSTGQIVLYSATVVGGTSVSAPAMAGIMALIDQKFAARQGLANYHLYELAAGEDWNSCNSTNLISLSTPSSCIFYDVTAGNNSVPGQTGYNAGPGYDLASGLGSVNAVSLAAAWNSVGALQATTTTLSVGVTSIQHGQPVPVTVQVSAASGTGTPSGSFVLVSDKYGVVASGTLTGGSFTGTFSSLPGGQYNLTAHYQGDGVFGPSDSSSSPITVTAENSSISIAAYTYTSSGPVVTTSEPYGQYLYFHAVVSSASGNGTASGTVTFYDAGTQIGQITLDNAGQGEFVSGGQVLPSEGEICLTVGTHSITASYSGDAGLNPSSTSQPLTITVTKATPSVIGFTNLTPQNVYTTQPVALTAFVGGRGPIQPTGTVQFYDNGTAIGSPVTIAPETPGAGMSATIIPTLAAGSHSITVSYSGDSVYSAGTSQQALSVTVTTPTGVATTTTMTATKSSLTVGQELTYTIHVTSSQTSPLPTGTIDLVDSELGSMGKVQTLQNGSASFLVQWGFAGSRVLTARYSGDSTYAASGSVPTTTAVSRGPMDISVTSSASVVTPGKQVSLTATMQPGYAFDPQAYGGWGFAGERIQFYDAYNGASPQPLGGQNLATIANWGSNNVADIFVYTLPAVLPQGTHVITAEFLGDPDWAPSTSAPITVYVGTPTFSVSTSASTLSVNAGQSAGFGLTLTPETGSGYDVDLDPCVISPPATGISCSYAPATVTMGTAAATSAVTIQTTTATPAGTYAVTVPTSPGATSGSSTVQLTVKLAPLLFTASASTPNPSTITAGSTSATTLTLTPQSGSGSGTVNLQPCTAAPATTTITCGYSPASLSIGSSAVSSSVTIQTTNLTPAGTYAITLPTSTAASNGNATVQLTVQAAPLLFTASASAPNPSTITAGSTSATTLTLTPQQNSGTGSLALQPCTASPASTTITCSYSSASIDLGSSSAGSNVTIQTTPNTPGGNYTITIPTSPAATGGNATVQLAVQAAPVAFTANASTPSPGSIAAGSSTSTTLTLTGASGSATDNVSIQACAVAPATTTITCSSSTNPVQVSASSSSKATITISTVTRGAAGPPPVLPFQAPPLVWFAVLAFVALLAALLLRWHSPLPRRRWGTALAFVLLAAALLLEGACNGGGSSPTPPPTGQTGTPAGTYTVTIPTSPGATNGNASVQFTVQ